MRPVIICEGSKARSACAPRFFGLKIENIILDFYTNFKSKYWTSTKTIDHMIQNDLHRQLLLMQNINATYGFIDCKVK